MCHGLASLFNTPFRQSARFSRTMLLSILFFVIAYIVIFLPFTSAQSSPSLNNYAPCRLDPALTNSPYCPQLVNNVLSPVEGQTYYLGSFLTCSWNSKWNTFATSGNVDVYICPNSSPLSCISVSKNVPSNVEQLSFYLNVSNITVGPYFYLVVSSGGSVNVPFSDRGASFTIASAPEKPISSPPSSTPTSLPSPSSPTPAYTSTPSTDSNASSTTLSPLAISGIVLGCVLFVCLIALLFFLYYRRRHHQNAQDIPPLPRTPASTNSVSFSASEAILLANSFKLALRNPWNDSEPADGNPPESVESTISELGMKSLPRVLSASTSSVGNQTFTVQPIHPSVRKPEKIMEVKSGTNFDLEHIVSI